LFFSLSPSFSLTHSYTGTHTHIGHYAQAVLLSNLQQIDRQKEDSASSCDPFAPVAFGRVRGGSAALPSEIGVL
jgi:hypothetical protein